MYFIKFGQQYSTKVETISEALIYAFDAYKKDWEVDVIDDSTNEIMVSLRDNKIPYISRKFDE